MAADVDDLYAAARAARPELELPRDDFAARLAQLTAAHGGSGSELVVGDLYLAWACAAGVPGAHAVFEREIVAHVPLHLARFRRGPEFTDEVLQALRERLLVGDPPRIAAYGGRGPLGAWVRVAAIRIAV